MAHMNEEERANEKRMMQNTRDWPRWPVLPIKKTVPNQVGPLCGFLYGPQDPAADKVIIYMASVWRLDEFSERAKGKDGVTRWIDVLALIPEKKEYPTLDALIADGWIVD